MNANGMELATSRKIQRVLRPRRSFAPASETVNFVTFARSEGRYSKHFDKQGDPPTLQAARQDRLENWQTLQELARGFGNASSLEIEVAAFTLVLTGA